MGDKPAWKCCDCGHVWERMSVPEKCPRCGSTRFVVCPDWSNKQCNKFKRINDEFVEGALENLKVEAERLIRYIDEKKPTALVLSKAWDIELRRRMLKNVVEEAVRDGVD